ncbi:hypothetical protein [Phenylobacterium sp.]|jgi:hypothetical protein|uniref:hypothetical protein n=1 Tax=Phenylobacterium sp. TaxID=1871053 RepID=UPI002E3815AA|nr:hypothetical protein [Phenylobacterium sp.]HEX2559438.1 hypothetical protein [Phenylobacterium sp.]
MVDFERARDFIYGAARLVERRAFAAEFEGGDAGLVLTALAAYQNLDGGFGHGLEPDTRTPLSQPLNVEIALQIMADARVCDAPMARRACEFLQAVSAPEGGVPILLPGFEAYAHAPHWTGYARPPELVPNGGLVGLLYKLGVDHPWREAAAQRVWAWIEGRPGLGAHDILDAVWFLEAAPDRRRAEAAARRLAKALPEAPYYKEDPAADGYGVTPLWYAPSPDAFCRGWFSDAVIAANLDHLAAQQQPDGGWPISWSPPGPAAVLEWRGVQTLKALRTLKAYGKL